MAGGRPSTIEERIAQADRRDTNLILQEKVLDTFRDLAIKGLLKEGESVMVSILPEDAPSPEGNYHRVWNKSAH